MKIYLVTEYDQEAEILHKFVGRDIKKLLEKLGEKIDEDMLSQIELETEAHCDEELTIYKPFDFIEIEAIHLDNIGEEPKYDIAKII